MSLRKASRSVSSNCESSSSIAAHTGTTSAPSAAARARTLSRCGLFAKPSSLTLAMYMSGFSVSRNRSRTSAFSSSSRPRLRADFPSFRPVLSFCRTGRFASASLSLALAARSTRCKALSTDSRSASASSVSMVSMSAIGSILPATCTMSGCSKQRTTCAIASTSRICARNLLPSPSPFEAPATRPAMSTNSTAVGTNFCGFTISASWFRRGSGTGTTPIFGSIVQNGKFAAAIPALVSALKSVDLPTFGRPTMPHLMPISFLFLRRVQALHRFVEITRDRERQYIERRADRAENRVLVRLAGSPEHPRRDPILVPRMADAKPQPMELTVSEMREDVAQSILPAVAAVELQPGRAGRQIQIVVRDQHFLRRDLPVAQCRRDRDAALVHERVRLEQEQRLAFEDDFRRFAVQLRFQTEDRKS